MPVQTNLAKFSELDIFLSQLVTSYDFHSLDETLQAEVVSESREIFLEYARDFILNNYDQKARDTFEMNLKQEGLEKLIMSSPEVAESLESFREQMVDFYTN